MQIKGRRHECRAGDPAALRRVLGLPGGQVVKESAGLWGHKVRSLVWELKSPMPQSNSALMPQLLSLHSRAP